MIGVITRYYKERKFGFVAEDTTKAEYPFWFGDLTGISKLYKKGDRVEFDPYMDRVAKNIRRLEG